MKFKEIKSWYKDVKADYDTWVDDTDMPEGDFNVLEEKINKRNIHYYS